MYGENIFELKGKKINLKKLGINFTPNEQQREALNQISDFLIDRENNSFTLCGYAGTGKTSVVKILLAWIREYFGFFDLEITAPTHRAKGIIEKLSGRKSKTIHSILGLAPNINIEKLDNRNLIFDTAKEPTMPKNLLIVDESSMVNDTLFKLIIDKCRKKNCQILFIGDSAQLKPVKQIHISKVFNLANRYELTRVERQKDGNPLGEILFNVRTGNGIDLISQLNSRGEGMMCYDNSTDFLSNNLLDVRKIINDKKYLTSRIICYTNDRVQLYNKLVRSRLGIKKEYEKGELLMCYANVGDPERDGGVINSLDYVIDSTPKLLKSTVAGQKVDCWEADLLSTDEKNFYSTKMLTWDTDPETIVSIGERIEDYRITAKETKNKYERFARWATYWEAMHSFISPMDIIYDGRIIKPKSIDYGYSHTIHKSQGGTYDNISVDYRDIKTCTDPQMTDQLLYVALSRPTIKANLFY